MAVILPIARPFYKLNFREDRLCDLKDCNDQNWQLLFLNFIKWKSAQFVHFRSEGLNQEVELHQLREAESTCFWARNIMHKGNTSKFPYLGREHAVGGTETSQ